MLCPTIDTIKHRNHFAFLARRPPGLDGVDKALSGGLRRARLDAVAEVHHVASPAGHAKNLLGALADQGLKEAATRSKKKR